MSALANTRLDFFLNTPQKEKEIEQDFILISDTENKPDSPINYNLNKEKQIEIKIQEQRPQSEEIDLCEGITIDSQKLPDQEKKVKTNDDHFCLNALQSIVSQAKAAKQQFLKLKQNAEENLEKQKEKQSIDKNKVISQKSEQQQQGLQQIQQLTAIIQQSKNEEKNKRKKIEAIKKEPNFLTDLKNNQDSDSSLGIPKCLNQKFYVFSEDSNEKSNEESLDESQKSEHIQIGENYQANIPEFNPMKKFQNKSDALTILWKKPQIMSMQDQDINKNVYREQLEFLLEFLNNDIYKPLFHKNPKYLSTLNIEKSLYLLMHYNFNKAQIKQETVMFPNIVVSIIKNVSNYIGSNSRLRHKND